MHKVTKTEHHTILEVRASESDPWCVIRYRNDMQSDPLSWTFTEEQAAHEWVQYQMGWLRYWSQEGPPSSNDGEASIKGYQDARADHAKQVAWDREKAMAWNDEMEEKRNGWMG